MKFVPPIAIPSVGMAMDLVDRDTKHQRCTSDVHPWLGSWAVGMIFQILGPMLATGQFAMQLIPGAKPRQLLATLLLHPNRFVSVDYIADNLWDGMPPASAAANMRTYVRSLRKMITEQTTLATIETRPAGYALMINPDDLDTSRVESLTSEAHHLVSAGDFAAALPLLDEATGLWRGTPLEDVPVCPSWQPQLTRLEQLHWDLVEFAIPLHVHHGDPRQGAWLVREVLDRDPYSEDMWCLLMRCHIAAGQPGKAAQAGREGASLIATELGVDVGQEFADLAEQARSTPEPKIIGPTMIGTAAGVPLRLPDVITLDSDRPQQRSVPTQLPIDVAGFQGRTEQLGPLAEALRERSTERPVIAVISGPPGIGKTSLAIRLAHEVRSSFPDGQVFLRLQGNGVPLDPAFAVSEALNALGVQTVPDQLDRAAALLRSELASRRLLLVIDDVATSSQLLPLIPGTGDSAALVTSRRRLTDVVGARICELDVLDPGSAVAMASEIAPDRAEDDLGRLAEACGHHPLALRIAASRLLRRPDLSVQALVERLTDPDHALNELTLGETAFRTSAEISSRSLEPADAVGFRVLGALDIAEFPGWVVDLSGHSTTTTDALLEANLLQRGQTASAEYRMHDLLRWHAREWGREHPDEVREGVRNVLLGWLVRARQAADRLPFRYFGNAIDLPPDLPAAPPMTGAGTDWFAAEQARLPTLITTAQRIGAIDLAWRLVCTWSEYFDLSGHSDVWLRVLEPVLPSANGVDDPVGEATVLRDFGQILQYRDDPAQAAVLYRRSAEIFDRLGVINGVGIAEVGIGASERVLGNYDAALTRFESAHQHFREIGNARGEALSLSAIASIHIIRGDFPVAEPLLMSALAQATELGDHHRKAQVLRRISALHDARNDHEAANTAMGDALEIFDDLGDHRCAGLAHTSLAEMLLTAGDLTGARREFTGALAAAERAGEPDRQAGAHESLAEVGIRAGRTADAQRYLARSVRCWQMASRPADADRVQAQLDGLR